MVSTIALSALGILTLFLIYIITREGKFNYERSGLINASADKIYPYLSNLRLGEKWNPYNQRDPEIKLNFTGADGTIGSKMDFAGNMEAGSGSVEIIKLIPDQSVEIHLIMTKPLAADNMISYTLTPEGNATKFTWRMYGDGGFMGKLMNVIIDCEKMMFKDFDQGIQNLKSVVESQK